MDRNDARESGLNAVVDADAITDVTALEPRMMFDGAAGAELADEVADHSVDVLTPAQEDTQAEEALAVEAGEAAGKALYIIDGGLDDIDTLVAAVPTGAEILILDAQTDGLAQITSALDGREGLSALHILSHGEPGALTLGSSTLDMSTLSSAEAEALTSIGAALTESGDIFIYGCDFGADAAALTTLADLTGADIAASNDITGAEQLGGDWTLEVALGQIEGQSLEAGSYQFVLAALGVNGDPTTVAFNITTANPNNGSLPQILDSVVLDGTTFSDFVYPSGYESDWNVANPSGVNARISGSVLYDITDPDYDTKILADAFTNSNLNGYQAMDGNDFRTSSYTLTYDRPIVIDPDGFIMFTERNGNNTYEAYAVDDQGNDIGRVDAIGNSTYIDTGASAGPQNAFATIIPLTDFGPAGTQFSTLRIEFSTQGGDGPDGKIIVFGDASKIVAPILAQPDGVVPYDSTGSGQIDPLVNDSTNGNGPLTVTGIGGTSVVPGTSQMIPVNGGTVNITTDGSGTITNLTFVPTPGFTGDVEIPYEIEDGDGNTGGSTISLAHDKDGDGVVDSDDLDDDNDGILDVDEDVDPNFTAQTGLWDTESFLPGGHNGNNDTSVFASATNTFVGTGVIGGTGGSGIFAEDTGNATSNAFSIVNVDATTLSEAQADDEYFQVGFTTAGSLAGPTFINTITYASYEVAGTGNQIGGDFQVAYFISDDNFATSTELRPATAYGAASQDSVIEASTANGADFQRFVGFTNSFELQANTSYTVRGYVFGDADGSVLIDELGFGLTGRNDTDGDGVPNSCDLDSDNDGISDLVESGQDASVVDTNGDGVHDGPVDPMTGIPLAANGGAGVTPVNSDGDAIPDYLDLDSDNDGISDNVEAQSTLGYVAPGSGDADGDGVLDAYDSTPGHGGNLLTPVDTDNDGTPDYLDDDSDGDGLTDTAESGIALSGVDANDDGIDDGTNASYADPNGSINTPTSDLNNADNAGEVDFRTIQPAPDLYTVDENGTLTDNILTNDPNNTALTVTQFEVGGVTVPVGPAGGTTTIPGVGQLTIGQNGALTFTPVADYTGPVPQVTYTVEDPNGVTSTTTVDITINPLPEPQDDAFVAQPGVALPLDLAADNGSGADDQGDGLQSVTITTIPPATDGVLEYVDAGGATQTVTAGTTLTPAEVATLTFTSAPGAPAAITPFDYTITDTTGDVSPAATVTITIDPSPDPEDDLVTGKEDTLLPINILADNGSGPDDPGSGVATATFTGATLPDPTTEGTLSILRGGTRVTLDPSNPASLVVTAAELSSLTFDPVADYSGTVATPVEYILTDIDGDVSGPAEVTIVIDPTPDAVSDTETNQPPGPVDVSVLANDEMTTPLDPASIDLVPPSGATGIVNGTAPNGDPIVTGFDVPNEGTWSVNTTTGVVTFTPLSTFTEDPTPISYSVAETGANPDRSNLALITVDYAPRTVDDVAPPAPGGTPVTVNPLTNDTTGDTPEPTTVRLVDPGNPTGPGVTSLTVPGEGTWSVNATTGEITFTPQNGFTGDPAPVDYTVEDAQGNVSPSASVTVDYIPVAQDDVTTPTGPVTDPVVINVLDNDTGGDVPVPGSISLVPPTGATNIVTATDPTNPSGPPIVTGVTVPGVGTWTTDPSGTVTFTPDPNFSGGTPKIGYTVADDEGNRSNVAEIVISYASGNPLEELENTKQPLPGDNVGYLDDLFDPEPYTPTLIVDVIIRQTASDLYDLGGTQSLDTGVNTRLGVGHPILAAVNSVGTLQGIDPLASGSLSNVEFNGIPNYETIGRTLASIGFDQMFDPLFTNDGVDELRRRDLPTMEDTLLNTPFSISQAFGAEGRGLQVEALFLADGRMVLHAMVVALDGAHLPVVAAQLSAQGADVAGITQAAPGTWILERDGAETQRFTLSLTTPSGDVIEGALTLDAADQSVDVAAAQVTERVGFSLSTERVASAAAFEQARLLTALSHGGA